MFHGQGERVVTVIVDGNNHNLKTLDGKNIVIQTKIVDNIVTMQKCKEITEKIRRLGHEPSTLRLCLEIFEDVPDNEYGDIGARYLLNKCATYNVKKNRLRIYDKDEFIYENWGGVICRDPVALADTYL